MHHRDHLRAWHADSEQTRTLRYLVEHRRRLVDDRTRTSNRTTSLLKCYFPQVLEWFPDIRTTLVCDFLLRWPALDTLRRVRRETLVKFFREHHSVRKETIEKRVDSIKQAVPLVTDRAVIASSVVMTRALAAQMKKTLEAINEFDSEIAALCAVNEDFALMQSLPGAGPNYAARLTAALGTDRERWQSADELARLSGIAPVLERSGKSCWVRWRYLRPEVPAPVLRRVRRRVGQALVLGAGLLRAAACEGAEPSGGGANLSLQVDQNHLQMLEEQDCLR